MKFTDGYWLTRPEYKMLYATEATRVTLSAREVRVIAGTRVTNGQRGALVDLPALTVTLSSPMKDVVCVNIVHFAGQAKRAPEFAVREECPDVDVRENAEYACLRSGALEARLYKNGWQLDFLGDGRLLTFSGFRGMAHAAHASGRAYMSDSLQVQVGEHVYGLGERFGPYLKEGQSIDMWNADGGTASEQAYKNIPFYMTSGGYGVFVCDAGDVSFEVQSEKVERVQFSTQGESLRYYVIYGPSPKEILQKYTRMTGRPALPPAWSFGLWLSTSFTTDYDERTTGAMIDGMRARGIPLSVFHFDCYWMRGLQWCDFQWDKEVFPDPAAMLKGYHEKGLRVCAWLNPYVAQASPLFAEGVAGGFFIKTEDGSVWQTDRWQPGMAVLDVTNPAARAWYCGYLEKLLDMGVDCFKTDFGERIPVRGVRYFDGADPLRMHNYHTFLYNRMVFELLERKRGRGEAVLFARSATAGCQRFPLHWGGDNSSNYYSMAETLRAGLSLAHCGFGFWSHDISGFEQTAPAHVYKRWLAFGLLSSHSRLHGSSSARVPWLFDEESTDVCRFFTRLKCRLMPYLYAKAVEAHETGVPVMRPMMLEFPDDLVAQTCDRQYMLGDSLLVAPVFSQEGAVDVYLPSGRWTSLIDGHVTEGGAWRRETHGFLSLPLMARQGCVILIGARDDRPDYDYEDGVTVNLYAFPDGARREVALYDTTGAKAALYKIARTGTDVRVETTSRKPFSVALSAMDGCRVV